MRVFKYLDYRKFIREALEEAKAQGQTKLRLASAAGIQPTYLTNVIKERAHLSADQIFNLGDALGMGEDEVDYLTLLMEHERSGNGSRKSRLKEKIRWAQGQSLETEKFISETEVKDVRWDRYYMNPDVLLVHLFLSLKKFGSDLEKITKSLNIRRDDVVVAIEELIALGLVEEKKGRLTRTEVSIHMPKDDPLRRPHQDLMRLRAQRHLSAHDDENYSFMVSFTANEDVRKNLHREFLEFLKKSQSQIQAAQPEEVYQLNFDLFKWS